MNARRWITLLACAGGAVVPRTSADVPFPDGYRRWVHVSSQLIGPASAMHARLGGLHHVYANAQAMQGLETGRYADGATFVFDVLHVTTRDDMTSEGSRRLLNVMVKHGVKYAATGGWGYEEFSGDRREPVLTAEGKAECASCHAKQAARDHVFSVFRP